MDRIWWFGVKDTIPVLCDEHLSLDPDMEPEWLANTIISTFQHGMAHGDINCSSVVGIGIPCYRDVVYVVQNICRIMYPTSEVTLVFLQNVSLHALRAVQYYFELSNTLVLVAEYVQTNVHIDWILANHLIGLLYVIQELAPQTLDMNINRLHEVVLSDILCVHFLLENNHLQIIGQFSLAVEKGYTETVRAMLVYTDPSMNNNHAIRYEY